MPNRDQLISATHTYAAYTGGESYAYDPTGNRTESHLHGDDYQTGDDNRIESDGTYWYIHDNEGNLTEKRLGSETGTLVTRYSWDHRNRLTKVELFDESTGDPLRTVGYGYDTFDRRVSRSLDEGSNGSVEDKDFFYYDGADVSLALDENLAVEHRYLHGPAVDMVLADEAFDPSTGNLDDVYWTLADHQGSIRDVATFDGTTTTHFEHVELDSYGRIIEVKNQGGVDPSLTPTVIYVYTGREWDATVELAYHRFRWYDPGVGRWLSQDPIGFAGGDQNLYRYVETSPTNFRDFTGLGKSSTSGNNSYAADGKDSHKHFGNEVRLSDGSRADRIRKTQKGVYVDECKPNSSLDIVAKKNAATKQVTRYGKLVVPTTTKPVYVRVWGWVYDAAAKRYKYVLRVGPRKIVNAVPVIGTGMTILCWNSNVQAKGAVAGTVSSGMDAVPILGTGKAMMEIALGEDLIPDARTDIDTSRAISSTDRVDLPADPYNCVRCHPDRNQERLSLSGR